MSTKSNKYRKILIILSVLAAASTSALNLFQEFLGSGGLLE